MIYSCIIDEFKNVFCIVCTKLYGMVWYGIEMYCISIITQVIIESPARWLVRKLSHHARYSPAIEYNSEDTQAEWRLAM